MVQVAVRTEFEPLRQRLSEHAAEWHVARQASVIVADLRSQRACRIAVAGGLADALGVRRLAWPRARPAGPALGTPLPLG